MANDRLAKVVTPLGDALLLNRMVGREELSRPFEYELVLESEDPSIPASGILGHSVTVELELEDEQVRYVNGIVSRFVRREGASRYAVYHATVRPWLWLLSRTADCRIFQNCSVPDVIKQLFRDLGFTDFDDALSGSYRTWEYLVQYRESSLNFVSRLMEQEGIYYYFRHESSKHTLVFADGYSAHTHAPGYEEVPYYPPENNPRERDHFDGWSASEQIQPGAYMLNDFDFTRPKASLQAKVASPHDHAKADLEVYDYPGDYLAESDGDNYAKARLQALLVQYEQIEGQGNARGLSAGNLFKLSQYPVDDQNREYLIVSTHHDVRNNTRETEAGSGATIRTEISAIASRTQYRPAQRTPKPLISGPQTAIVVGKAGEEIWTDQHGRVKVQFHWDRLGKSDENSSCWVRVSQVWAGARWGAMHIPRLGQEVIVEFLEGDPDRPIITGRVYNGDNKPPYDLPANQTQSGIKSRSTKSGNPDNFNELRFEDHKGEEHVYLRAEKDLQICVKHDETRTVDHDRFKDVLHNETTTIGVDRTETVGNHETITIAGNRTESVSLNESVTISMNRAHSIVRNESLDVGGHRDQHVSGSETIEIKGERDVVVGRDHSIEVSGNQSWAVAKDENVEVSGTRKQQIGADDSLVVGRKLVISAGDQIVIKTGDASITMKKNGDITISGKNITLKGSGKINLKASGDVILKGSKVTQN